MDSIPSNQTGATVMSLQDTADTSFSDAPPSNHSHAGSFDRKTSRDWREKTKLSLSLRNIGSVSTRRVADLDDEEGKAQFFFILLIQSIEDSAGFFAGTITSLVIWSILCAYGANVLREHAAINQGGNAETWLDDIENCKNAVSVIGTLFVFILVFRFNACYDRWWESRIFWGDIVSSSLELGMMNRRWLSDDDLMDKFSRFIVVFSYACKSLLRGKSLKDEGEDGPSLVKKGLLAQKELDIMHEYPSWQPYFCLDVIREVILQAHMTPCLRLDESNKVHGQLFRCFDNTIKELNKLIGNCVRVRASGLPASYDAITMTSFIAFFLTASVVWSASIGWMTPIIVAFASTIIMFLIVMGTKLVDPFGTDKVDIPMEDFCATIEAQIQAIDQRSIEIKEVALLPEKRVRRRSIATFHVPKLS